MNPIRVIKINAHTRLTSCILGNCACCWWSIRGLLVLSLCGIWLWQMILLIKR